MIQNSIWGLLIIKHNAEVLPVNSITGCDDKITVTRLLVGRPRIQFPAAARNSSLLQNVQTSAGVHPACYSRGTGLELREGIFPLTGKAVKVWVAH
jgi:hypothetical protein